MIKIILHGCNGKMGKVLQNIVSADPDLMVVAGIDANVEKDSSFPQFPTPESCTLTGDVVIDFSHHTAVPNLLEWCRTTRIPVVVSTTALGEDTIELIRSTSCEIPVFRSANMSLGINAVVKMLETVVPFLENDYFMEIIEKHHAKKADSPSGTALLLAESINEACVNQKEYLFGRHSKNDQCSIKDLGIHAVRGGTIPGEHTILFAGDDEVIEITHTALSKTIFANGAVKAAKFLAGKPPGLYTMKELLGN